MKIGLFHSVQFPEGSNQRTRYMQAIDEVLRAEALGFDSVWLTEHHFFRHGIVSDSLNMLSYLAAKTSSVRLGTAVCVLPLHNPVRLAETAAMVDVLSGGRLDLGIGRGYQPPEFSGFGLDIGDKGPMFDEAAEVIRRCWTEDEPFSHEGAYWQFRDAQPQPRPVQLPHPPIWYATDNKEGFEKGALNDWGILLPQGSSLEKVSAQMTAHTEAYSGRINSEVYLARALHVAPTDAQAWHEFESPYTTFLSLALRLSGGKKGPDTSGSGPFATGGSLRDSVVCGSPDTCIALLRKISELGVTGVMFYVHWGTMPPEQILASMMLFGREVMPAARELGAPVHL